MLYAIQTWDDSDESPHFHEWDYRVEIDDIYDSFDDALRSYMGCVEMAFRRKVIDKDYSSRLEQGQKDYAAANKALREAGFKMRPMMPYIARATSFDEEMADYDDVELCTMTDEEICARIITLPGGSPWQF